MNPPELGPRDEVKTQQAALFHVRQLDTPKTKTLRPSQNQSLPRLPWCFPWFQLIFHDFPRIFRFSNPFEAMISKVSWSHAPCIPWVKICWFYPWLPTTCRTCPRASSEVRAFRAFQGRRCRGFWGKNAALGWFNYVQLVFRRSGGGLKNLGMVDFFWNSAGGWGQVCHFPSSLGQLESLQRQDIGRVLMVWYQLPKCFGLNAELSTNALDVEKISKNTDWSNREVISRAG